MKLGHSTRHLPLLLVWTALCALPQLVYGQTSRQTLVAPVIRVECANGDGGCPSAVGVLFVRTSPGMYRSCTATVVAPRLVLTNYHCVREVAMQAAECRSRVFFFTAQRGGQSSPSITNYCDRVLAHAPTPYYGNHRDAYQEDWALVQLSEPVAGVTPMAINRSGTIDGESYTVYNARRINHHQAPGGAALVELQEKRCQAVQNTAALRSYQDRASPIGLLRHCQTQSGDSGSPVIDNRTGGIAAVIHAQHTLEGCRASVNPQFDLALATNLACQDWSSFGLGDAPRDVCGTSPVRALDGDAYLYEETRLRQLYHDESSAAAANPVLQGWALTQTPGLRWRVSSWGDRCTTQARALQIEPVCYEGNAGQIASQIVSQMIGDRNIEWPELMAQSFIDENMAHRHRVWLQGQAQRTIRFSSGAIPSEIQVQILDIQQTESMAYTRRYLNRTIGPCGSR